MDKFIHVYPTNSCVFKMLVGPKCNVPARSAATISPLALQRSRLKQDIHWLPFASAWWLPHDEDIQVRQDQVPAIWRVLSNGYGPIWIPYSPRFSDNIPYQDSWLLLLHFNNHALSASGIFHVHLVFALFDPHQAAEFHLFRAVASTTRRRQAGRNSPRRRSAQTRTKPVAFERCLEGMSRGHSPKVPGDLSFYPVRAG